VKKIVATRLTFCALTQNNIAITWGDLHHQARNRDNHKIDNVIDIEIHDSSHFSFKKGERNHQLFYFKNINEKKAHEWYTWP
jgi:hypothetical protein